MIGLNVVGAYSRMPVKLPHALRLDHNICGGDRLSDGEVSGVDFPPLTTTSWCSLGGMLEGVIHV